jgi:hypothetical protein
MNGNWKFLFFFSKFKRGNSVQNQRTITIANSNLTCAFLWQTYTCNLNLIYAVIENGNWIFFLSSRGITLSKINGPLPNSNLTCAFLCQTYTCNLNLIHTSKQKLESRNWIFFKRDNSVKNHQTMTKFELDLHNHLLNLN